MQSLDFLSLIERDNIDFDLFFKQRETFIKHALETQDLSSLLALQAIDKRNIHFIEAEKLRLGDEISKIHKIKHYLKQER